MKDKYIIMKTSDLKILLALAQNPTLRIYEVIDSEDNTDGKGKWHCDVKFYTTPERQEDDDPSENYSFDSAQTLGELIEAKWNAKYLNEHPFSSCDMHGLEYWANRLETLRGKLEQEL